MTDSDKRFLGIFKEYYSIYLNTTLPPFAAANAADRMREHMELYKLELEVRLAEAKKHKSK